jgi:hypothetical protein
MPPTNRASRSPAALPLTFRASPSLRFISGLIGLVCGTVTLAVLFSTTTALTRRLAAAAVLAAPAVLAAAVVRRRIVVEAEGLAADGLFRSVRVGWREVLAIEQTRRSFVIITERGDISAGWIDGDCRDLLFRKVLELARLTLDPSEPRWGVVARFLRAGGPELIRPNDLKRQGQHQQQDKK